jgi:hypothetical protein
VQACDEAIEFIVGGPSGRRVADFQASPKTKARVEPLIRKEKTDGLTPGGKSELDDFMALEHLMRLAKARARRRLAQA